MKIQVRFENFSTECTYDFLSIYQSETGEIKWQ